MKHLLNILIGLVVFAAGCFVTLGNINVVGISFYRFMGVNTGAILIVVFILLMIWMVVRTNILTVSFVVLDVIGIIVSVIMGTRFSFRHMSALDLLLMTGLIAVGLGLMLKGVIGVMMYERGKR